MTARGVSHARGQAPAVVFRAPGQVAPVSRLVFVIAAPRKGPERRRVDAALHERVKGARFARFHDLFDGGADYQEHWRSRLASVAGAVVVPSQRGERLVIGHSALREARHIHAAGRPVLLLLPGGLLPWPQVRLQAIKGSRTDAAEILGIAAGDA